MKQLGLGLNLSTKKTCKREFLEEMERVVPWAVLVQIVAPHHLKAKTSRPPFGIETMLRIRYLQQWFGLSDPAMEEALHDETTILRSRHLLERHDLAVGMLRVVNDLLQAKGFMLRTGAAVDATLISAPSSTKNDSGQPDPEMKQTQKGNQWYFGMKAHIARGRSFWAGAQRGRHGGQRQRGDAGRRAVAWRGGCSLRRCRLPRRAQAA